MRGTVAALAARCPVAIVSGRDRIDVRSLVQLDTVFYAGSHGFDISGPDGLEMQHEQGKAFLPLLDQAATLLQQKLNTIAGTFVERKKFSIAVHFRNVAPQHAEQIESVVDAVLAAQPQLRKGWGKKVFELQPRIDWHKGKADPECAEPALSTRPQYRTFPAPQGATARRLFGLRRHPHTNSESARSSDAV